MAVSAPDKRALAVGVGRPIAVAGLELVECWSREISHGEGCVVDAVILEFLGDGLRAGLAVETDDVHDSLVLKKLNRVISEGLGRVSIFFIIVGG